MSWIVKKGLPLFYPDFLRICITVNCKFIYLDNFMSTFIAALKSSIKFSLWFIISLFIVFSWSPRCCFVSKISFISHHLSYGWPWRDLNIWKCITQILMNVFNPIVPIFIIFAVLFNCFVNSHIFIYSSRW